MLRTQDKFYFY